jgi:hypothetical protein
MKCAAMATLKISQDFSPYPGARYYSDGSFSGEEFYDNCLKGSFVKSLDAREKLFVDLDGTAGYASSFLSESFGLLAESFGISTVEKNIEIISKEEPDWKAKILNDYIPNALTRKKRATTQG